MKVVVVGLGVQGHKRKQFAGSDFIASVDPVNGDADFRDLQEVPLDSYDAVLACIPDEPKFEVLSYALSNRKHVLVEKPLWVDSLDKIRALEKIAQEKNVLCYTAYNHRFEPHFVAMKMLIDSGELGKIYSCSMMYGNGTARLVRESEWRDRGHGVLSDLGSHLLDTCAYWFPHAAIEYSLGGAFCFENNAPDHVVIDGKGDIPRIHLEMTLCMWRNHFTCDVIAEKGSAHIRSLCKWGPSTFTHRTRVLPSGRPPETSETLVQSDPTWELEYAHLKELIQTGATTDLSQDIFLHRTLKQLGESI